jgi:hypothetical protein
MTIQERVQDIFNKFNVNLKVEESRTELAEAALDNGTVIYTDGEDFVEGDEAFIINDEGERIPLPPGDYTLKDGGVISIADGGKIAAVNKGGEGKDAKDGKASNPAKTKEPVTKAPDTDAPLKPAPTDPSPKEPAPVKPRVKQSADFEEEENPNDMEEVTINYVTREEVEAIVAEAIAAAMGEPAVEEATEEEKEEMSVNPEAPKAEAKEEPQAQAQEEAVEPTEEFEVEVDMSAETPKAEAEEVEAPNDMDVILTELSQVKERLFELQKQAASTGLKHKAPTPKKEPLNLQNLTTEERVRALANHYNA